ncbi:MAG: hypothetical protein LBI03_00345 [Clostridiales bacterium]|jgi:hypothetical protein|nr:hypothetical protein [Clostridiales bacterium]
MSTCGTPLVSIITIFIIGLFIGVLIILYLRFRSVSLKKKHGFKDSEMIGMDKVNPSGGALLHTERKETVDGSTALKDFKKQ